MEIGLPEKRTQFRVRTEARSALLDVEEALFVSVPLFNSTVMPLGQRMGPDQTRGDLAGGRKLIVSLTHLSLALQGPEAKVGHMLT